MYKWAVSTPESWHLRASCELQLSKSPSRPAAAAVSASVMISQHSVIWPDFSDVATAAVTSTQIFPLISPFPILMPNIYWFKTLYYQVHVTLSVLVRFQIKSTVFQMFGKFLVAETLLLMQWI